MSDFAWTLIDTITLGPATLYNLFYKEKVRVWEGIKVDFQKMSLDGMDGISM